MGIGQANDKSVGKNFEIDQRAMKIFGSWVPDAWLPRKQDPDFFIDYLVETVENGEPTGTHFAAQIKGYNGAKKGHTALSKRMLTKHLKYYFDNSLHPVFIFLINVATGEGYWLFVQKYLKEKSSKKTLNDQNSLSIHFNSEDCLSNITKFKCLLPEAVKFVRELHPGSIGAALKRRKAELESKDPRFSYSISIEDGNENVTIIPNEIVPFSMKLRDPNEERWNDFFERGKKLKVEPGEIEFIGIPALQEALSSLGKNAHIQFGNETPGALHVISKEEVGTVIPIHGHFRNGTKYFNASSAEFMGRSIGFRQAS